MMFMQKLHKTYPGSGSLCTGIAAMIKNSVVNDIASGGADGSQTAVPDQ